MRKQKKIWQEEHAKGQTLPTMANVGPTSGLSQFVDWLGEHDVKLAGRAVDIGSGQGRNSVYLARRGFNVIGLEYIAEAREIATQLARVNDVSDTVLFQDVEINGVWPFDDDSFDVAIDSFSSIDVETYEGRKLCRGEMFRTLKKGGYALVNVCSADDEWEAELIANHPGSEPNSTIWPQNGKFQKDYTEDELRDFYADFEIVELKKIQKPAHKLGRDGTATNLWMVLRKK